MIIADGGYIDSYDYPVTVQCIVREAVKQNLEPEAVWAILRQENGRVNKHSLNKNKTLDIGPMQINNGKMEKAIRELQEKANMSYSVFKNRLYSDACFNVSVGAYVLRLKIDAAGSMFRGMGWYNSANEPYFSRYLGSVKEHYYTLKRSPDIQRKIAEAKQNLYANEYKIQPIAVANSKKIKKSQISDSNTQQVKFYNLPRGIRLPSTQIVYR